MSGQQATYKERLDALRAEMQRRGLAGFVLPRAGRFLSENLSADEERLKWLTGFTGSAGTVIVTMDKAVVLTDGRYTIQVKRQVDGALYETGDITSTKPGEWIAANMKEGAVGYDPWLHSGIQVTALEENLKDTNLTLRALEDNPADALWQGRPPVPCARTEIFPKAVAGAGLAEKRAATAAKVKEAGALAAIITPPDSVCWLLNVRGGDVEYAPLVLSYAFVYADGQRIDWFVDSRKVGSDVRAHLGNGVSLREFDEIEKGVDDLAQDAKAKNMTIMVDAQRSPAWFRNRIAQAGAVAVDGRDPCVDLKALKTPAEQKAIAEAHIRDGAAIVKFLAWLEGEGLKNGIDEIGVAEKLEEFRSAAPSYRGPSFATIAGWGANGAVVHYRAEPDTNLQIGEQGLLLLDSGGQYTDGTTDITRTIAVGEPSEEIMRNFTLVLKGHIAVARAKFKPGTPGVEIDALARKHLKESGLDYAHGTGHGVGCYLQVHEDAASLSPRGKEAVKPGMLLSNEPGYYKEGEYGIRIENLVLAQEEGGEIGFKTMTLAPISLGLIDPALLDEGEKSWLNDYHARVFETLEPLLDKSEANWLRANTAPL